MKSHFRITCLRLRRGVRGPHHFSRITSPRAFDVMAVAPTRKDATEMSFGIVAIAWANAGGAL